MGQLRKDFDVFAQPDFLIATAILVGIIAGQLHWLAA
jgi:hypothetical protein